MNGFYHVHHEHSSFKKIKMFIKYLVKIKMLLQTYF